MRKIKRFLSALLCGAILITGTLAGVSVRTDAAASSYAVQLRAAGFQDSYISALSALHTAYPQWQFQAVKTGLDWNTVVSKESVNGVNLVPKTGNDATKSTADGAYDWTTNVWTVYDGSSWVGADADYIAYYLDPRNFLTDIHKCLRIIQRRSITVLNHILHKGSFQDRRNSLPGLHLAET